MGSIKYTQKSEFSIYSRDYIFEIINKNDNNFVASFMQMTKLLKEIVRNI